MPAPHKRTTTQRGYGHTHQRIAKALKLAALGQPCPGPSSGPRSPNCVGTMRSITDMDADHGTPLSQGGTQPNRVCCRACNRSHGGRLGAEATNTKRADSTPSRNW